MTNQSQTGRVFVPQILNPDAGRTLKRFFPAFLITPTEILWLSR